MILYVSPHELRKILETISSLSPDRLLCLNKELTKLHEESLYGTAEEILLRLPEVPKGEYTLVTSPFSPDKKDPLSEEELDDLFSQLTSSGMSGRQAVKKIAELTGMNSRELYSRFMKK